jgi:alpha-tubulin suppressor-like RCC1 family protein
MKGHRRVRGQILALATLTAVALAATAGPSLAQAPFQLQSISAGYNHACGITAGHVAYCWGRNAEGELGNPSATTLCPERGEACSEKPVRVVGGLAFTSISAGHNYTCAITTGGAAYCWGANAFGQLGTGVQTPSSRPARVALEGVAFTSVSAGDSHTCAVASGGTAYCWGSNAGGKLGTGGPPGGGHAVPTPVAGHVTFRSISAGYFHTCGVARNGATYCWGRNEQGEVGTTVRRMSTTPVRVAGDLASRLVQAASEFDYSCAVDVHGVLHCWGSDCFGQLGLDSLTEQCGAPAMPCSPTPAAVNTPAEIETVSVSFSHSCALTTAGTVLCWGDNNEGQTGNGTMGERVPTPTPVAGGLTFGALGVGREFTCAIAADGAPYCWGRNVDGQLGIGSTDLKDAPTPVVAP